jgi:U5 small nuclear ribonucleoprotein component
VNFNDEVTAALRLSDGLLLCVDAAEGLMLVGQRAIAQAVGLGLPIVLMITKVRVFLCIQLSSEILKRGWGCPSC